MRRRKKKGIREAVTELARERLKDYPVEEKTTFIARVPIKRFGRLDFNRAILQEETRHEHTNQLP